MSSTVLPSRGQCIQAIDGIQRCQCQWFSPPESLLLDQSVCSLCGHSIHAHADYVSAVVHSYPANQCAAYVQKTPLTQRCACEAWLCDHLAINNSYRFLEPWTVLDYFSLDNNRPSPNIAASSYSNDTDNHFSPNTTSSEYNTATSSGDARNMPLTLASTSSPSAASASSAIQPNTTQTLGYSSDGYFPQYPNHFVNSPYAGPPEGAVTNGSFEYQDYGNVIYPEPSGAWPGSYGA